MLHWCKSFAVQFTICSCGVLIGASISYLSKGLSKSVHSVSFWNKILERFHGRLLIIYCILWQVRLQGRDYTTVLFGASSCRLYAEKGEVIVLSRGNTEKAEMCTRIKKTKFKKRMSLEDGGGVLIVVWLIYRISHKWTCCPFCLWVGGNQLISYTAH